MRARSLSDVPKKRDRLMTIGAIAPLVLGLASFTVAAQSPSRDCSGGKAFALLIGINDYALSGERDLAGPENDVSLMKDLLRRRFGLSDEDIATVTNADATHLGIQKAFKDLANKESACDFVYIHYSGHGAQFDNANKEERCGNDYDMEEMDQTWVSFGARSKSYSGDETRNNHDVLDDEINDWLSDLDTDNYVFVSDSCHSGTVFRGDVDGVRSASNYQDTHPLAEAVLRCKGDARGIKIGAARDIEEAIEIRPRHGNEERKVYGRFTWYWAKALENALPSETWSDVFDRAYAQVISDEEGSRKQSPQITGNAERSIFGGDFQEPAATVQIIGLEEENQTVTLAAGAVANMTEGSEFSLFRRGEPVREDDPRLRINSVAPATSVGEVLQGTFSIGDPVVETRHVYQLDPYTLFVDPSCGGAQSDLGPREQDRPLFQQLRRAVDSLEGFEPADSADASKWILCLLRPHRSAGVPAQADGGGLLPRYFADADPEVWVVDQGLRPIHQRLIVSLADRPKGIENLHKNLKAYLRGQEVIDFGLDERPGKKLDVSLYVTVLRETPTSACEDQQCRTLELEGYADKRYRVVGKVPLTKLHTLDPKGDDFLEFRAVNNDKSSIFAYLLNVSKNLDVSVIFPRPDINAHAEYAKVDPGEDAVLDYAMWQLETGDSDWFKFIASKDPIDVNVFVRAGLEDYRSTKSADAKPSALEEILAASLHTRGKLRPTPVQTWTVEQTQLTVE